MNGILAPIGSFFAQLGKRFGTSILLLLVFWIGFRFGGDHGELRVYRPMFKNQTQQEAGAGLSGQVVQQAAPQPTTRTEKLLSLAAAIITGD